MIYVPCSVDILQGDSQAGDPRDTVGVRVHGAEVPSRAGLCFLQHHRQGHPHQQVGPAGAPSSPSFNSVTHSNQLYQVL